MQLRLDMTPDMKHWIIQAHDFYVEQVNKRVLAQFKDIKGDADRYAKAEYERLSARYGHEDADPADVAESAHDNAIGYYSLLHDLRQQVILGALAGLYHQWEKQLREFINLELAHEVKRDLASEFAWSGNIGDVFGWLDQFGWNVRVQSFFPTIDACRLIVNVYKHGQGPALAELNKKYPEYLPDPIGNLIPSKRPKLVSYEWLAVSEEDFAEIAKGLRAFWKCFPGQLTIK